MRTLMYYDNVGSIVPQQYFYYPEEKYDPFMLSLVRANLVTPIDPTAVLDNPIGVAEPFIELIQRNENKLNASRIAFQMENSNYRNSRKMVRATIHRNKFESRLFDYLIDVGLAAKQDEDWFIIEPKTANNLMQYLASIISSKTNRLPVTDYLREMTFTRTNQKQQEKRETILKNLIPYPMELDLTGLMRFKERHGELANSFRNRVEQVVFDKNIVEGTVLFHLKMAEMLEQKEELLARMRETRNFPRIFFGSVCGIISGGTTILDPNPISVIGTLAGFGSAVYSALQIERAENVVDQSGMKYLALADHKLKR